MEDNKPSVVLNSRADKEIRDIEYQLTQADVQTPFFIKLSDLSPEEATKPFGSGTFSREEYALSWSKDPSGKFRLILTNIPHKNSKLLIKTPDQFKDDALPMLNAFIEKFSEKFNSNIQ